MQNSFHACSALRLNFSTIFGHSTCLTRNRLPVVAIFQYNFYCPGITCQRQQFSCKASTAHSMTSFLSKAATEEEVVEREASSIAESQAADLLERYSEPQRAYHTTAHIVDCLDKLSLVTNACTNYIAVALALVYHDAMYDPRAKDNEERSADLAARHLEEIGFACKSDVSTLLHEVRRLIMLTCHGTSIIDAGDVDGQIMVDIDLSILGRSPQAFDKYESEIRKEYSHVPEAAYRAGRAKVLQHFLDQPRIYTSEHFFSVFETRARTNLAASLRRLEDPSQPLL